MCKNIISALILIYQPIRILSHGVVKQKVEALYRSYLNILLRGEIHNQEPASPNA